MINHDSENLTPDTLSRFYGIHIAVDSIGGNCPVQATGTVSYAGDKREWYLRARGEEIALSVAHLEGSDPVDVSCAFTPGFYLCAWINTWPAAGWIEEEDALRFLYRGLLLWGYMRHHEPKNQLFWRGNLTNYEADPPAPILRAREATLLRALTGNRIGRMEKALEKLSNVLSIGTASGLQELQQETKGWKDTLAFLELRSPVKEERLLELAFALFEDGSALLPEGPRRDKLRALVEEAKATLAAKEPVSP